MSSTLIERVPRIDFTSLNFASITGQGGFSSVYWEYSNPQYTVLEDVGASTSGGHILPIPSAHQNATWLVEFPGPALSCQSIDPGSVLYNNITNNILTAMVASIGMPCLRSFGYISWVPTADVETLAINLLPFPDIISVNDTYEPPSDTLGPMAAASPTTSANALALYLAALPGMSDSASAGLCAYNNGTYTQYALSQLANMTLTQCTMYNTSYIANFTYINGAQNVNLTTQGSYNYVTYIDGIGSAAPHLNRLNVENFAYQAVMDAFGRMFVGTITVNTIESSAEGTSSQTIGTAMVTTPLLNTRELNFLQSAVSDGSISLQAEVETTGSEIWNGFSVQRLPNSTLPMARVMEEMFKNATISLMSSSLLQLALQPPTHHPLLPLISYQLGAADLTDPETLGRTTPPPTHPPTRL